MRQNLKTLNTSLNEDNIHEFKKFTGISASQLNNSKWLFLSLCFYLFSQSFTIPILAIGTWATWINLSDLATVLLILMFLLNLRYQKPPPSNANAKILLMLIFVLVVCIFSYLSYLSTLTDLNANGIRLGIYQIYRLIQFICIFAVTAQIPITPERANYLKIIINCVLIFVCLSIILTFSRIIPLDILTSHLPEGKDVAGAWSIYQSLGKVGGKGLGTIGYNHAYVASQVTLLASLRIHLGLEKKVESDILVLLISICACFISESRAGFFGILVFAVVYMLRKPRYMALTTIILFLLSSIFAVADLSILDSANIESAEGSILDRQTTLLDAGNADNLSGRNDIWIEKLKFLNQEPIRWIVGTGFGTAWDNGVDGGNAHMLYLHIILENGITGLLIFVILFSQIIYFLSRYENGIKTTYWVTICLLIVSLTQETFYPVIAFGHFLGFYLCSVAIALRRNIKLIT
jgi:O-antigen ligase